MLRPKLLARISTYEVAPVGVLPMKGFSVIAAIGGVEVEGPLGAVGIEMVL
jgi:hypothetical protein